ncbi:MAG TPA: RNA polymerase sigma factor SigJ [Gammaproteobacteria bacterium]|nr:RNA polymerase sigma factor SigJ [Gammaproteobacteria bacterium]
MELETADSSGRAAAFEEHRRRLWGVAYRMLGSHADADDIVQEAYLRWHGAATGDVRAPQAWLVTTTARLCIDRLRQRRAERVAYVGPWLPEPLVEEAPAADAATELASDLSVAFLALLERLAPEERAAFLLHDVFESGYSEIAAALGKSEAACRQIVSRARRRVREERPRARVSVSPAARERLVDAFMRAVELRDRDALVALFAKEATLTADGGGKAKAAHKVVRGGASVARFMLGVLRRAGADIELRKVAVNREPGVAVFVAGRLISVISLLTDGTRILGLYSVLNPDKLRNVTLAKPS